MKRILPLAICDRQVLRAMSNNPALSSHPLLREYRGLIAHAYATQKAGSGAVPIQQPVLPAALRDAMESHYDRPCAALSFIEEIRRNLSPGVCPVCGAASAATVDHVLPKSLWPVYAFFSRNLVPACDQCNRKKGAQFHGGSPNARPIHPYYDDFLTQRVVVARLIPPYPHAIVEVHPVVGLAEDVSETVEWQLAKIVRRTSISSTLQERWLNICRDPNLYYETLVFGASIQVAVQRKLFSLDAQFGTPNNWESMLQSGILADPGALAYLDQCRAQPLPNPI